ncbi:class Ib ribonucleoside-diphosphate reductase assembly flavoprotein NrdI [Priestia taiwanensis]|uniref:Protein NrdI n=1 Tax=Priestia taiwanensis TaxID=1347902 RepID=A0A917ERG3_9BACI|nr:class Ib ribonucleoside-diphosphate reductase assembly flavoprotein NrdI [Priestia taiwanensis]MBM7363962.1 protein involved in ribonucleotide reduction [Priestia taiwanensis]GGE70532.1 protein NrdI [Priestia taiwanensis]
MVIVYDSMTGNVKRFVNKLQMPSIKIHDDLKMDTDFILVTYTTGFGSVPDSVRDFLDENARYLRGVSASGNRNWGTSFAASADKISVEYNVPVLTKFEMAGTTKDVEHFIKGVEQLEAC